MDEKRIKSHGFTLPDEGERERTLILLEKAIRDLLEKDKAKGALIEQVRPIVIDIERPVYAGAFFDHDIASSFLLINSKPFSSVSDEARVGVLAHEAIHFYRQDEKLLCTHEGFDSLFALAVDICINDSLKSSGFTLPGGAIHGERVIGIDCSETDPEDVLEILLARIGYIPSDWKEMISDLLNEKKRPVSSIPTARFVFNV